MEERGAWEMTAPPVARLNAAGIALEVMQGLNPIVTLGR